MPKSAESTPPPAAADDAPVADAMLASPADPRYLLDAVTDGIVFHAASGEIVTCNASAERILGLNADQMRGRLSIDPRWRAIREDGSPFPGEEHPAMVTLRTGKPLQGVIMGVHKPDGSLTWISIGTVPLGSPPQGVVAEFRDLTERRRVEGLLRSSMAELEDLYNHAPCGYHSVDREGRFLRMNDTELRWLGYTRGEVVGQLSFRDILAPASRAAGAAGGLLARLFADGFLRDVDLEYRRRDGSTFPVLLSATAIVDDTGDIVASRSTVFDISEIKRKEQRIRQLNRELERRVARRTQELADAVAEMEAFAYAVSHDLRAPVRAIDAFGKILLEEHAGDLGEQGSRLLERVISANQRQRQMIEDLLHLSRASTAQLVRTPLDLSDMARSVVAGIRQLDPDRSVDVSIEPGMQAEADRGLVRIVLENLIGNAWKFTARTPAPAISIGLKHEQGVAEYFVRDNGAGFEPRDGGALFRPFQRLHSAGEFPGTGVGLATVHRIVRRHGGHIRLDSSPGIGTTASFTLGDGTVP